jgi:hypothetical protein
MRLVVEAHVALSERLDHKTDEMGRQLGDHEGRITRLGGAAWQAAITEGGALGAGLFGDSAIHAARHTAAWPSWVAALHATPGPRRRRTAPWIFSGLFARFPPAQAGSMRCWLG